MSHINRELNTPSLSLSLMVASPSIEIRFWGVDSTMTLATTLIIRINSWSIPGH